MHLSRDKIAVLLALFSMTALVVGVVSCRRATTSTEADLSDPSEFRYKININRASEEELTLLPGVGRTRAQMIIEHRAVRPFGETDDLKHVRYPEGRRVFDEEAVFMLRDRVTVSGPPSTRSTEGTP